MLGAGPLKPEPEVTVHATGSLQMNKWIELRFINWHWQPASEPECHTLTEACDSESDADP